MRKKFKKLFQEQTKLIREDMEDIAMMAVFTINEELYFIKSVKCVD
jgi:hypothetical protein